MRKQLSIYLVISFLFVHNIYGQETLETVSSRGNVASRSLQIGSGYVNANTTKLFINNSLGKNWALSSGANQVNESGFHIYNWTDNNISPLFSIWDNGYVGVGITHPSEKFQVNGNIKWGGVNNYMYSGQDLTGVYFEQISNVASQNKIRFQASRSGDAANYAQLFVDATNGFSFITTGNANGNVGIGTATPSEKLSVNGKIRAQEVKVEMANWPDYVFEQDYKILGLQELDAYIKVNKHLPDMPSAKEAEANGIPLGEMNKLLLKKVEELTLHLIEQDKQFTTQQEELKAIKSILQKLTEKK
ncbi:hypothetical protein [Pedobacter sp. Leaf176]|uniref:hypothetical protein n=1 Tax=Pedobacter sp. Leaf176 TaxID=1736286 RepID=UPI00070041C0|nr:hypothetical protein [Pedobacter sp. Leaf176]KQR70902.1 hypothetical protein ASF92_05705 [Pedobacter sp. Leaf176]